jgi:cell division protein FtsB
MTNILEILENEFEKRKLRAKEFYHDFCRLERENKKLIKENQMLRNDLQELSKEFINQNKK